MQNFWLLKEIERDSFEPLYHERVLLVSTQAAFKKEVLIISLNIFKNTIFSTIKFSLEILGRWILKKTHGVNTSRLKQFHLKILMYKANFEEMTECALNCNFLRRIAKINNYRFFISSCGLRKLKWKNAWLQDTNRYIFLCPVINYFI